jgi:hypothetical protein
MPTWRRLRGAPGFFFLRLVSSTNLAFPELLPSLSERRRCIWYHAWPKLQVWAWGPKKKESNGTSIGGGKRGTDSRWDASIIVAMRVQANKKREKGSEKRTCGMYYGEMGS